MKIAEITTTPLAFPFKEPYHWAGRCDLGAAVVLVKVTTDTGLVGIGESTAGFPAETVVNALRGVEPLFIGESPFDIEPLFDQAKYLGSYNHTPWFANLVLAGLEMALWDLIGKATNQPVCHLFGGAFHREIDYFGFLQGDTTEELVQDAEKKVADGYSVIYMKVGRGERADLENVAAVRDVIGELKLRLDANQAWYPHTAIHMIRQLARYEPEWIEQPTLAQPMATLKQVKDAVDVPIAIDQGVFTLTDVYEVCRQQAADAIVLSIHEAGGLLAFKKAAAVAEAAGIAICLHGQSVTGVTDCAQHQIGLTIPNLTDGNQIMHQLLMDNVLKTPDLALQNGRLGPLNGSGLGVELDWQVVGHAALRYSEDSRYHHA